MESTSDLFTTDTEIDTEIASDAEIDKTDLFTPDMITESLKEENPVKTNSDLKKTMLTNKVFPSPEQDDFQYSIYKKRNFILHSIQKRKEMKTLEEIKEFRESVCARTEFKLQEHQSLLSNFINPNTPYKGVLVFHGTGSGKTCAAVATAEKFKPMVEKYGTKIHVLVPGPLLKQNWLNEIIKCTGNTYLEVLQDKTMVMSDEDLAKAKKIATNIISQYYRVMTHRSFYKKVLGEKIREKIITEKKTVKATARKTETGEYERETSIDRIYSLDNTLLIIDEAHSITDNEYGDAITKIIENSKQLKILLLSATPMKNVADDIIYLLNYLRPLNYQIERDKIFTSARGNLTMFKPGGKEYLRKMSRGYVSYLRGADPLTYAERIEIGEIPPGLDFTHVTRCYMEDFQLKTYNHVIATFVDALDRISEAVASFVFPGVKKVKDTYELEGLYGIEGLMTIRSQLKNMPAVLNKMIASGILASENIKDPSNLLTLSDDGKNISGDIFEESNLKHFSIKFYQALQEINLNVWGKKGPGIIFVYSNLVRVGMELFREVAIRNGYLEYQEDPNNYVIKPDTQCYFCGRRYDSHDKLPSDVPKHKYFPATFLYVTGQSEEIPEKVPEETTQIIGKVSNNIDNKHGKYIKLILGSRVMNEGISLRNIREIHILDVHHSLGRVDQAIGRGIRWCVHYDVTTDENPFPKVLVYKYVVSVKGQMSSEEELYKKAEQKYKLIKETERILQEEAIDCPLNYNGNVFPEEIKKYKNCGTKENPCPAVCGYISCDFKCADKLLDAEYYDPERHIYRTVAKADLDYSTYDNTLANEEISYTKDKIKDMYKLDHVYILFDIIDYVKKSFPLEKRDLFDEYYVFKALYDLLPVTTNDFNNFKDSIIDKYNRPGYLIYRNKYYIFNPFGENEYLPMHYRRNYSPQLSNKISLNDYINHTLDLSIYKEEVEETEKEGVNVSDKEKFTMNIGKEYDFHSVSEYYENKPDYKYVGIIDQDNKRTKEEFKLRKGLPKVLSRKRETGVPTFKGAVCQTAKDKETLLKIASQLKIPTKNIGKRTLICTHIRNKLFDLEKYSTVADKNKLTYLIIPFNHPTISFPLNLEDRVKRVIDSIQKEIRNKVDVKIRTESIEGRFPDITYVKYILEFGKETDNFKVIMESHGAVKKQNHWIIIIE